MFYVKEKLNDAVKISVEINDENVFCRCPRCGAEVRVDLAEVFANGKSNLFNTSVLCESCGEELLEGVLREYEQV